MEEQASGRTSGVDGLVEDDEVDHFALDLVRDLAEVENRARKAVQPCDDELVTFSDKCQSLRQSLAFIAGGAALLLLEDLLAAMALELVELGFEVLPDRRDAGVSDFHRYQMC